MRFILLRKTKIQRPKVPTVTPGVNQAIQNLMLGIIIIFKKLIICLKMRTWKARQTTQSFTKIRTHLSQKLNRLSLTRFLTMVALSKINIT